MERDDEEINRNVQELIQAKKKLGKSYFSNGYVCTGCSLNIVFFTKSFVIFLNSASSAAALVFHLPGVCTHTDTEGKQRKAGIFLKVGKNTIFNEDPVEPILFL